MTVERHLVNPETLQALYGRVPDLQGVNIRSINLSPSGPSVSLRVDLPYFPGSAPREWVDAGVDAVQCQLQFLDVENISLTRWTPPTSGDVEMEPWGDQRRMRVGVRGSGVSMEFHCYELATVSHVSAFKMQPDGADSGLHLFASKLDARLYKSLPGTDESKFYGR
ncbi:Imm50 family immunity protein [Streptomyces sp. NPDC001982]|uniref:Imm50 family immunity protein n=1 Tax=unclassified Streptomyces TaxID=2593676 RepID=UPI003329397D